MNPQTARLEEVGYAEEIIVIDKGNGTEEVVKIEETVFEETGNPPHHHHHDHHHHEELFVFVNRRKFTKAEGVKRTMTGAEIAALVSVPADKAVIKREHNSAFTEIGAGETVTLHDAEQFLVTRKTVEGGHGE